MTAVLAWVSSLFVFRIGDKSLRIFSFYCGLTLFSECSAFIYGKVWHNNMPIYSIYSLAELLIISIYFNYSVEIIRKNSIGWYIGFAGLFAGVLNIIYLQPLQVLNSYFLYLEGIIIISFSLFSFAHLALKLIMQDEDRKLYRHPHFWIAVTLIFFWSSTFLGWGLYDYMNVAYPDKVWIANASILVINIITYSSYTIVFLLYPKMIRLRR